MAVKKGIAYKSLLEFWILHAYYLDKKNNGGNVVEFYESSSKEDDLDKSQFDVNKDFEIRPLDHLTVQYLKNHRLLFRQSKRGFSLFARLNEVGGNKLFVPIDNIIKLSFGLFLKNTSFLNFTDLSFKGLQRRMLYFSNWQLNLNQENQKLYRWAGSMNNETLIPVKVESSNQDDDTLEVYFNKLDYFFNTANIKSAQFSIKDYYNQSGTNILYKTVAVQNGNIQKYTLNISALPAGVYQLSVTHDQGGTANKVFYKVDRQENGNPFGVVELFIDKTKEDVISADGELWSPKFYIFFKNRKTSWRYFDAKNPSGPIQGYPTPSHSLAQNIYYDVIAPDTGKNLPNASVDRVTLLENDNTVYSDIYISKKN